MMSNKYPRTARTELFSLLLLLTLPFTANALEGDKDQPIYVEADSVDIDDAKGTSTYRGNVELTQGSIRLTAAQVVVTQSQGRSDQILATGNPVTYRRETEGDKGMIKARGRTIEYRADSEILYLIGDAVLSQGKDSFKSDRITYDRVKAVVKAGASAKGKQRVRTTISSGK
ncbi:MAG: lipopolysaccharide transport periplasmic protein LptA [Candidatus Sedimenticola endophacoides]